jgi:hypothetical protein
VKRLHGTGHALDEKSGMDQDIEFLDMLCAGYKLPGVWVHTQNPHIWPHCALLKVLINPDFNPQAASVRRKGPQCLRASESTHRIRALLSPGTWDPPNDSKCRSPCVRRMYGSEAEVRESALI